MEWLEIGHVEDIPLRGARCVKTPTGKIAVFRTADNAVHALDDMCPHKRGPLSQGIVHDAGVTCPLHNWVISLEDGRVRGPDEGYVRTYPLRVENGTIFLALDTMLMAAE